MADRKIRMIKCGWKNVDEKMRMAKCGSQKADDKTRMMIYILLFHVEENSRNSLCGIKMCVAQKLTYNLRYSSYSYI